MEKIGFAKASKNQAVFQSSTKCDLHFDSRECEIIDISLSGYIVYVSGISRKLRAMRFSANYQSDR